MNQGLDILSASLGEAEKHNSSLHTHGSLILAIAYECSSHRLCHVRVINYIIRSLDVNKTNGLH